MPHSTCLELGSGTGQFTRPLASVFPTVISLDLSEQMLRQAAGCSAARVRADAGALAVAVSSPHGRRGRRRRPGRPESTACPVRRYSEGAAPVEPIACP
ncbi:class I SAM-dependent methyltransferase [Streptomyces laculatispora]|uniref:class I SAM-dependent methyltransferase n=1 Tax=Streptomyces laculatispora TaxID=887464 RepID=UPI001A94CCF5|nr:class I SAM-dependent methyltransferase [Streptomyces laculatispora]MBO0913868.1 class I SAM-dependent methyltransferase [Streptomyces laculatispora]